MMIIYLLVVLFALCWGSFLNVLIYRLPLMLMSQHRKECALLLHQPITKETDINLWFPRSFCPHCKKSIKAWQNIPVLSYFLLKGRCKHCHQKISFLYPLIEILTALFSLIIIFLFGLTLKALFAFCFLFFVLALFFIDLKHQLLPDCLTLSLLWLGLLANRFQSFTTVEDAVVSTIIAYLSLWIFIKIYCLITGKIGMGNGDFKLFAAFGAWFGLFYLPFILIFSALLGIIVGLLYLKKTNQSKNQPIPFGPFLSVAGIIVLLSQAFDLTYLGCVDIP